MNRERFTELKRRLIDDADFGEIWNFYMDHFADHQAFIDLGEQVHNRFLETVIPTICHQIFRREMRVSNLLSISIAPYHFIHGPVHVEGRIGGYIYFEDAQIGMIAVPADVPSSGIVKYSRFSPKLKNVKVKGFG